MIGTLGCIAFAILIGGQVLMFVNVPSILIVFGGTLAVTFIKYPLSHTLGAVSVALKAFFHKPELPSELILKAVELATVARREGLIALEEVKLDNEFMAKGLQFAVDGHDPEIVKRILGMEINLTIERHEVGQSIFKGMGDSAPAMGMIGTLIGLVQMMANMSDPSSIGPAMAVALLTTLYGAVIANAIALPIADKLAYRSAEEKLKRSLILEAIYGIQTGANPMVLEETLNTFLPIGDRVSSKGGG